MFGLDIVIVNWNSGSLLRECLTSLAMVSKHNFVLEHIFVIDNASHDGSCDILDDSGLPLKIVKNSENRGFAAACNQGARLGNSEFVLFLNPDTLLHRDTLHAVVDFMTTERARSVGIVGSQMRDSEGLISKTCARFPTVGRFLAKMLGLNRIFPRCFPGHYMVEWGHQDNREVDQVMGAFFFVRRQVYNLLHGFDERFFVYFEEVDFSYRAKLAGWNSFYLADAQIYHKGGGTSEQVKATRLFYSLRSRILYGYKHFGRCSGTILMLATLLVEPLARLADGAAHRSIQQIVETIQGYIMLFRAIPEIVGQSSAKGRSI